MAKDWVCFKVEKEIGDVIRKIVLERKKHDSSYTTTKLFEEMLKAWVEVNRARINKS